LENLAFDRPARYRIRAQGRIKDNWSDRLEGMAICQEPPGEAPPTYTLEGELLDQAALMGVLNTLYELHQIVLLVKRLQPPEIQGSQDR
jgi:hypothetical protein